MHGVSSKTSNAESPPAARSRSAAVVDDFAIEESVPAPKKGPRFLYRPALDISLTGAAFIGMMCFMGLAAINSQANLLFGVFGLMVGILIVSGIISRIVLRRLTIRRELPEYGIVGQTMRAFYTVSNRKRFWPSLSISISELDGVDGFAIQPQCYMLHTAAGMTARVPADLLPRRRGLHEFRRMQLGTSFPFGFIKRARFMTRVDHALIYPALAVVNPRLLASCKSADSTGPNVRPKPGGMDEFYGIKEYRAGDSPRSIYWRRSARTGVLVSREMTEVAPPRIVVLVDTYLADRSTEEHALVERSIAMAASLAASALDQGLSVGLFAWAGEWFSVQPMHGKQQRSDILSAIARLPLNLAHDSHELMDVCYPILRNGTTPVLFTPRKVQMGLREGGRGSMLVISASTSEGRELFTFEPTVDFHRSMPTSDQPPEKAVKPASIFSSRSTDGPTKPSRLRSS